MEMMAHTVTNYDPSTPAPMLDTGFAAVTKLPTEHLKDLKHSY